MSHPSLADTIKASFDAIEKLIPAVEKEALLLVKQKINRRKRN